MRKLLLFLFIVVGAIILIDILENGYINIPALILSIIIATAFMILIIEWFETEGWI